MAGKAKLLYVEDDLTSARLVQAIVEKEGYAAAHAATAREALRAISDETPDLLLLDLTLPDGRGLDLLEKIRERNPQLPAIVVTASDSVQDVIGAMKRGAVDYLTKPIDAARLVVSLGNVLRLARQERDIVRLRSQVEEVFSPDHIVGGSTVMGKVRTMIRRAAPSSATVLIHGESGTGKELVAKALHYSSPRSGGAFVDVNCAALTETLLESELFGHEKGAFTSAVARRHGKFEQAHGGTLFLDEIGDMPLPTQAKMLRVLQERSFQRVGGEEKIDVDVRVICATNRSLEDLVKKGQFRKDLLYRINTLVVEVPALRDRAGDIPDLARHFMDRVNRAEKRDVRSLSTEALEALCRHRWPGNVRELQHAIDRAVLVCEGSEILPEHLPPAILGGESDEPSEEGAPDGLIEAVERLERSMILAALDRSGWVKAKAARTLKVTERILSYKMSNLGIDKPQHSGSPR